MPKSDDLKNRLDELFSQSKAGPEPAASTPAPTPAGPQPSQAAPGGPANRAALFQLAFADLAIGVVITDLDGRFRQANAAFCRMLGYEWAEIDGLHFQDLTHPEDQALGLPERQALVEGKLHSARIEKRYLHKDGRPRWVDLNISIMPDDAGQPISFITFAQDTSAQHSTAEQLERRMRELSCLNDIGHKIDEKPGLPEFFRWTVERIPAAFPRPEVCIVAIDYQGQVYGRADAMVQSAKTVGGLRVGGELLGWLHVAYTDGHGFGDNESALVGSLVSRLNGYIETNRLLEQSEFIRRGAQSSEQMLSGVINNIPNPIFFKDTNGKFIGCNQAFLDYVGRQPHQVIGKTVYDVYDSPELARQYEQADAYFIRNPQAVTYEAEVGHADGALRQVIINKAAIRDTEGKLVGMVASMLDITSRKQAETKVVEEERRLEEALRVGKMAHWELDVATQMFSFNEQWFRLWRARPAAPGDYRMPAGEFATRFMHPDSADKVAENIAAAIQTADPDYYHEEEVKVNFGDGSLGYILLRMQIQKDEQGRTVKLYGTNQDVTDRKLAELLTQRRAGELATVAEMSTAVAAELDPQKLLQSVVDLAKEKFNLYHAHIYLLDADRDELTLAAGAGEVGRQMAAQGWTIPLEREHSLVAQAARTRQGVTVNDVTQTPDFLPNPLLPDTRSELAVPLAAGERVLGALDVQSDRPGAFQDEDLRIQTTLAAQVAVALENAQRYAEQKRVEEILAENEQRFRSLVSNVPGVIYRCAMDENWTMQYLSSPIEQITGYPVSDFINNQARAYGDVIHPEDSNLVTERIISAVQADEPWAVEYRIVRADGAIRWVYEAGRAVKDEAGNVLWLDGGIFDIDDRKQAETKVVEEERRLEEALRVGKMAHWELDVATQMFSFNEQWFRLWRARPAAPGDYRMPAGEFATRFMHPDSADKVAENIAAAIQTADPDYYHEEEVKVNFGDGSLGYILLRMQIQKDEQGRTVKLYGTNQDVTDRKLAELLTQRRAGELATVAEMSTAVAAELDPQKLLQSVVDLAKEKFNLYHAHIYLLDADRDELTLAAGAGEVGRQMAAQGWTIPLEREHSLVAQAARTRQGVTVNDVTQTPDFLPNPLLPDTRSELAVPLAAGERVLGALDVQSDRPGAFQDEDLRIQTTLAAQVAVALENARLFAETQQRINELALVNEIQRELAFERSNQAIANKMGDRLVSSFAPDSAFVCLYERAEKRLNFSYFIVNGRRIDPLNVNLGEGLTSRVILNREPLMLHTWAEAEAIGAVWAGEENDRRTQSHLSVPLMLGDEAIGAISIQSYQPYAYNQNHLQLLQTLASSLSILLENARQYEETRNSEQLVRSIIDATPDWVFVKDVNHRFILVNQSFAQSMGRTVDEFYGKDDLQVGFPQATVMGDEKQGLAGYWWDDQKVLDTGQPLTVTSEQNMIEGELRYFDVYKAPLRDLRGVIVGLLGYARDVTERERLLLEAERQAQVMAILNEMGRVLSDSIEVDHILKTVHAYANRLMDASNFFVALYDEQSELLSFPLAYSGGVQVDIGNRPRGKGLTDYVLTNRQPLLLTDHVLDGMRAIGCDVLTYGDNDVAQSWLGVPLIYRSRTLGALAVQSTKTPGLYNERHRELLMAVAAQAANALILAEQFQATQQALAETREYAGQVGALNDIAAQMNVAESEAQILQIAGQFAHQIPAFDLTSLSILEEAGDTLALTVISQNAPDASPTGVAEGARLPAAHSASGKVIRERRLMAWPEDGPMDEYLEGQQLKAMGLQGMMAAPLTVGGKAIGALNVASWSQTHFAEREKSLLRQVAALTGASLENRRLLEQVQKRARQEQVLREISTHVRSSMDADVILRATVRELGDILGRKTFIRLGNEAEVAPYLGGGSSEAPGGGPAANDAAPE